MIKKVTNFIVVVSISTSAYASKARLQALQKAEFLTDVQTTFINPAHVNSLGQLMTFEFGGSSSSADPKAEGGLFVKDFGANTGVYLGHVSPNQKALRDRLGYENQNNPVDIFYAKNNWGAALAISNSNDKTTEVKEKSLTGRFGTKSNNTEMYGSIELYSDAEKADDDYTGGPQFSLGYETSKGVYYLFATLTSGKAEHDPKVGDDIDANILAFEVGAISRKISHVYYGASFDYEKIDAKKDITSISLPVFMGIEKNVNSWMVLRASVVQSVLISEEKDEYQAEPNDEKKTNKNDTTVAAGVGIKINSFELDGVISGSTTGNVSGNSLLSQASLTYRF